MRRNNIRPADNTIPPGTLVYLGEKFGKAAIGELGGALALKGERRMEFVDEYQILA